MADWSLPTLSSTYTNFLTEVKNRDVDLALQFDGTTSTNLTTGTIRWNSAANIWQKWTGSAWGALSSTFAFPAITTSGDQSIVAQHNGSSATWYGRILSKNSTADRSAFLGTYGSNAGVFAHNHGLNAWADLYVNTTDGGNSSAGNVRLPSTVFLNGNQALHAGNFTSYSPTLTGTGASGTWGINVTGTAYGLDVHTGRNNEANRVVRTDVSGYLQTGYINSSSGDENNASSPPRIWGTNGTDSYLRTYQTSSLSVGYASSAGTAATATALSTYGTSGQVLNSQGSGTAPTWRDPIVSGTAVATTSGVSATITGVPSWAKRITMMLDNVTTSGTSIICVRVGAGSVQSTGYFAFLASIQNAVATSMVGVTDGFIVPGVVGTDIRHVSYTLTKITGNTWVISGTSLCSGSQFVASNISGLVAVTGTLDRISLTTQGGANTFTAGTFNITYE
jgi:hypothetical protein